MLWSSVQGPDATNATVLKVDIVNSTNYWTVTFPADSQQPINVLCHAPSSMCPLSSAPSCVSAPSRNSTSRNNSLLSMGNMSTCVAGSAFNASQSYGLRVSCPFEHHLFPLAHSAVQARLQAFACSVYHLLRIPVRNKSANMTQFITSMLCIRKADGAMLVVSFTKVVLLLQAQFYPFAYPNCSAAGTGATLPDFTQLTPMLSRCQDSLDIQVRSC